MPPAPPAPSTAPSAVATARPGFAAALFGLMFLVSATVAVYSGWLLWRGEVRDPALLALPAACAWVVVAQDPAAAAKALREVADQPHWTPLQRDAWQPWAAAAKRAVATAVGLDTAKPWALCGQAEVVLGAAPALASGDARAGGQAWVEALWQTGAAPAQTSWLTASHAPVWRRPDAGTWRNEAELLVFRDATGSARASVQAGPVVRVAWAAASGDAVAGLRAAHGPSNGPAKSAAEVAALQEALERVGGGELHGFASKSVVEALQTQLDLPPLAREGLGHALWAAVSLRVEAKAIRLHGHLGADPRAAVWLKNNLDVVGSFDVTPLVEAGAQVVAISRLPPSAWSLWGNQAPVLQAIAGSGQGKLAGPAMWQQRKDGSRGYALQAVDAAAAAQLSRLAPGQIGQGARPVPSQVRGDVVLLGASLQPPAAPPSDPERRRFYETTQGVLVEQGAAMPEGWLAGMLGPLQLEWLWLDTGVVVALALRR